MTTTTRGRFAAWERRLETATARRDAADHQWTELIRAAVAAGVPGAVVARGAGVSTGRVSQIAPRGTPAEREKEAVPPARVTVDAEPATVPATLTGERASTQALAHYGQRATVYLPGANRLPGDVLRDAAEAGALRVYLCGKPPELGGASTKAERVRSWFLAPVPGWRVADGGHYLADVDVPVGRWTDEHTGATVEVHQAAAWHGDTGASTTDTSMAFGLVEHAIGNEFSGGILLATPATTGRDLWRRAIPRGKAWPVLSAELRQLIRETTGQGRIELLRPAPASSWETHRAPAFTYLDGVLMYAGLTWGMPAGDPVWHGPGFTTDGQVPTDAERERMLRGRGRWRVRFTVPKDWSHVGLVPAMSEGGTWCYPAEPGRTFTSWVDGSEAWLAMGQRWGVTVLEGFTFTEGKPLDTWTRKLLDVWRAMPATAAGRLGQRMVRSMLLFSIGAFAAGSHKVTRTWPADDAEHAPVPDGVAPSVVGDVLVWDELHEPTAWSEDLSHPEYAATVWARARVRLLDGPAAVSTSDARAGALWVPPADVIGFATDALYLANKPDWDEAPRKPGTFRVKGTIGGARPWPATFTELWALRDEAEGER